MIAKVSLWMKTVLDAAENQALSEVLEEVAPVLASMPTSSQPTDAFLQAIRTLIKKSKSQHNAGAADIRKSSGARRDA